MRGRAALPAVPRCLPAAPQSWPRAGTSGPTAPAAHSPPPPPSPPPALRAEYYPQVTTTRKYEDRLATLEAVRGAGISVCAGGIIGLGEGTQDRVGLLHQVRGGQAGAAGACACARVEWGGRQGAAGRCRAPLAGPHALLLAPPASAPLSLAPSLPPLAWLPAQLATLVEHPESVPINALVAVKGTPMQNNEAPTGACGDGAADRAAPHASACRMHLAGRRAAHPAVTEPLPPPRAPCRRPGRRTVRGHRTHRDAAHGGAPVGGPHELQLRGPGAAGCCSARPRAGRDGVAGAVPPWHGGPSVVLQAGQRSLRARPAPPCASSFPPLARRRRCASWRAPTPSLTATSC